MLEPLNVFGRAAVVLAIVATGLYAFFVLSRRAGFEPDTPLEPTTWHGRPVSQEDHEPQGPRYGFVLFMLVYIVLLFVAVTVADSLFG